MITMFVSRRALSWLAVPVLAAAMSAGARAEDNSKSEAQAPQLAASQVFVGCFSTFEDCDNTLAPMRAQWPDWNFDCSSGGLAQQYCALPDYQAAMFADHK